ncbi:ATP-binding cassette sub-family A member 3-like [Centruroides sculpturatus]|uniref:ATP-binding cassette sub-family A member 3-like n=1 Tax=Centruroides sculpturatus TaxID=218467 RepID=UPI000C6DBA2F|nr:ATP-binding cassette sub-family A member 3-like [Centruroides sculpturatus]
MSILTGMFPPTSGTVIVNGYNILTETTSARKSLGLCPQHNVLYDNLTVKEHLKFFGGLKNLPWSEMEKEIAKILALLQLSDKQNALSKDLSGGMKRKLSLGIAIIGGSKILILDEPTSGMDPEARRVIWDALLELRGDRTVLLTTHYMEEADALGDRIAIMAEGSVKCCGSSIFLKGKFGTGYHLHIAKGDGCKVDEITRRINRLIPEAKIVSNINQQLVYSLSSVSQSFGTLFESMENSYSELGIVSCGISVTTMEDVFLKVGKMSENNLEEPANDCETEILINSYDNNDSKLANSSRATGSQLVVQQMKGLFLKRFHYAKRDYVILIFQLIIPILVISNLMWIVNKFNRTTEVKPLDLNLKKLYSSTNAFYNMMNEKETPFLNYYKDKLKEEDAMIFNTNDTTEYQLERSDNLKRYIETDLVGASIFEEDGNLTIISWFNAVPYHLDAISLNLMTTSLLKYLSKNNESDIQITNHPLPSTLSFSHRALVEVASHFIYIVFVALALTFLTSSFILFPIHERVTKCKLLQRMCGINAIVFWFIHLLWDFLIHVFCSFLLLIPFFIYSSINSTLEGCAIGAMFFVLIIYGWASLPLIYLMSFIPNKSSTGFSLFTIVGITTGLIAGVIVFSLNKSNVMDKEDMDLTLAILQLSPVFAAGWAISNIHNTSLYNTMCDQFDKSVIDSICESRASHELFKCCPREICQDECFEKENYLSWEFSSGRGLAFLSFDGLLYFTLLVMFETILPKLWYKIMTKIRRKNKSWMVKNNSIYPDEDSDVTQERNRIENIFNQPERNDEALIVKNLTKYFGSFRAVNNLTFSVHKEECFGLLGINGAGKTTTFRMLTGDLIPSEGNAFIGDYDVQNQTEMFQRAIGYCPQFDALIDGVTGREMLTIFANLRGIPKLDINYVVNRLIEMCDLVKHADKKTETYSGGTKRKLSLGLALIGSPSLVLLDEPTAGVDPVSRRKMWETLITMRQLLGVSFVLTSHGMDECEALCKRIVIMVNGQFHCLGDMQHLKTKFGQGYTLIIKVKRAEGNEIQEVKSFVENTFPSSSLKDSHQEILHYHITDTSVKWSKMFFKMEEAKQTLPVEDYLISDTTLEQIFLAFARTQMETQNMTE